MKCIDLTAVSSSVCFRHITLVHACLTQTLDCSRVDSLFSLIVMTDLACHKVNLIDYIKVGQQNSKLPFTLEIALFIQMQICKYLQIFLP